MRSTRILSRGLQVMVSDLKYWLGAYNLWRATPKNKYDVDKCAAREKLSELIVSRAADGYEVAFERNDETILIDRSKNILKYEPSWSFFQGHDVREQSIRYETLKKVKVALVPSGLYSAYNEYTIGGLLVGGLTGLVVGSVIDAMKGPRKEDVFLNFEFEGLGDIIFYTAYFKSKVPITEDSLEPVVREVVPLIDKINNLFPDKVVRVC